MSDVVGATLFDEVGRVCALGVHGVCGDDHPGQVDGVQQRLETGDLVGLIAHFPLRHNNSTVMSHSRR
jgi:hypothetical protein